jgi:uncharacterized membrane protein
VHLEEKVPVSAKATLIAILSGVAVWLIFLFGLHQYLIGVSPLRSMG